MVKNITITTCLVDTVTSPMVLKTIRSKKLAPEVLITHQFRLAEIIDAYGTFGNAAKENALKVILADEPINIKILRRLKSEHYHFLTGN